MKIIAQSKDYYDHVAHVYGGGDPKIVYDRRRMAAQSTACGITSAPPIAVDCAAHPIRPPQEFHGTDYHTSWLAVMGRYYLLLNAPDRSAGLGINSFMFGPRTSWRILSPKLHPEVYQRVSSREKARRRHTDLYDQHRGLEWCLGMPCPHLLSITKKIGQPVFHIIRSHHRDQTIYIEPNIPNLGELGMASIYPAEQMYQDLSYFVGNVMNPSPDMAPPTVMSDTERIVQHGFDLQQSFRHRK
jgi:hypothetical protein